MADATSTRPGTDPDRASFTIALHTARDLVIEAHGIITRAPDLLGVIGHHILAALMPDRRIRTSPRAIKRAISKYNAKGLVTEPATKRPSTSTSSPHQTLDQHTPRLTERHWG